MKFRHLSLSSIVLTALTVAISVTSCSKKDVVMDEPLMKPSLDGAGSGQGSSVDSQGKVDSFPSDSGAGEAGGSGKDLNVIYFAFDSYVLNGEARGALKSNAKALKGKSGMSVQIEGHCDERGSTEYNLALGERRANAVKDYLLKLGVKKSRLSVISYGEERPQDPGHDEAAWTKNRRAVIVELNQ